MKEGLIGYKSKIGYYTGLSIFSMFILYVAGLTNLFINFSALTMPLTHLNYWQSSNIYSFVLLIVQTEYCQFTVSNIQRWRLRSLWLENVIV